MTVVIITFGALTLLAGMIIVINPKVIFGFLRNNLDNLVLHILAVVVRLVLGVLLIYQSSISKFPFVIEIIGWLSIVAAIFFTVMGRCNFNPFSMTVQQHNKALELLPVCRWDLAKRRFALLARPLSSALGFANSLGRL
jgi:hypothetical protein